MTGFFVGFVLDKFVHRLQVYLLFENMLKRPLIFLVIFSLLAIGYFAYKHWQKSDNPGIWGYIPSSALLVYENNQVLQTLDQMNQQQIWKSLSIVNEINAINNLLPWLDSVNNYTGMIYKGLDNSPVLISAHKVSRNKIDFLFNIEIKNISDHTLIDKIQEQLEKSKYVKRKRKYMNLTITELVSPTGKTFAFFIHKNVFVGSFTPFLVEDAIRTYAVEDQKSFQQVYPHLLSVSRLQQDQGNIYLNLFKIAEFTGVFTNQAELLQFAQSAFLDLKISDKTIEMSGFSFSDSSQNLTYLAPVVGATFNLAEIVSNQTGIFHHYSFSNPISWGESIQKLDMNEKTSMRKKHLIKELDFDINGLYKMLDKEAGISWNFTNEDVVIFAMLETKNSAEINGLMTNLAQRYASQTNDTIYIENYKEQSIIKLPISDIPRLLLGTSAVEMQECYFTTYRNYALFSSGLPEIKELLDDIENENTWKLSVHKNQFLSKTNQEAGFSLYLSTPILWRYFREKLTPEWRNIAEEYEYVFQSLENVAIQFNIVDDKFFTNILIEQETGSLNVSMKHQKEKSVVLSDKIISKPQMVRTHAHTQFDFILQDSSYTLYYLSPDLTVEWELELGESILGNVLQMDYFRNGKIQNVFITENKLHIVDREGNYLSGFPLKVPNAGKFNSLNLIDYDGDRNYRIAIADEKGNIFLTDKEGKPLNDWNPLALKSSLIAPMRHFKIGGSDVLFAVLSNGEVHILNRKGNPYPGFPIFFEATLGGDFNLVPGSNFTNTKLSIISESGEFISMNLKGSILSRNQFLKPELKTSFSLINDLSNRRFIIGQQTSKQLSLFTAEEDLIFTKDYLEMQSVFTQYYFLGTTRQYVVVGEKTGELIYIYNFNGKLVTGRPIKGNQPIGMIYFENDDNQLLYIVSDNEFSEIKLTH